MTTNNKYSTATNEIVLIRQTHFVHDIFYH